MTKDYTPEKLLAKARGFMESRLLIAGAELDIFTLLAKSSLSATEIVEQIGGHLRPMTILLDALSALGLLIKEEGRYRTEEAVAPYLSSDTHASVRPMILHSASLYKTWLQLTHIVKDTGKPERPASWNRGEEELKAFIGAMHVIGKTLAAQIVAVIDPGKATSLLDIGAGPGTYSLAFLQASATLRTTLFDQPAVIEIARRNITEAGFLDRASFIPGDFYTDDLPGGHDLALLSAIIHQNSREQNVDLYRKVHAALVPEGRLIIRDHIMNKERTQPPAGAIFAVNMLVATTGGGTYTFDEIEADLKNAGFVRIKLLQQGFRMDGLIEAYK